MRKRYFLKTTGYNNEVEVTKEEWIRAERSAGFRPKIQSTDPMYMKVCATGGFSSGYIQGIIRYEKE